MARLADQSKAIDPNWIEHGPKRTKLLLIGLAVGGRCFAMIIATARDAATLLEPFFASAETERVVSVHLDPEQRLIETRPGPYGNLEEVDLPIRPIIVDALRLGSFSLIIAHNHPSGNPNPSDADLRVTRELAATARSLGIRLFDHLIFGRDGDCRSLRALGLL